MKPSNPFVERRGETTVIFGEPWSSSLPRIVSQAGWRRVAILTSARRTAFGDEVAAALEDVRCRTFGLAEQHVPRNVVTELLDQLRAFDADALLTYGGGSAVGLGKAIRLQSSVGFVAIPTTYAGSEMTAIYGIRDDGHKTVGHDPRVRPDVVLYDPRLTLELAVPTSVVSLFNAMAHAVDVLYAEPSEALESLAEQSITEIAGILPALKRAPRDLEVRTRALNGAYLAGVILSEGSMALHHKLAHVLGGHFNLPHAETHAAILPHVVAFNAVAAPRAQSLLRRALGADDPARALHELALAVEAPTALSKFGLTEDGVIAAATFLAERSFANPRVGTVQDYARLIDDVRVGRSPLPEIEKRGPDA